MNYRDKPPFVSLIVPVFNEELSVAIFTRTVRAVLSGLGVRYEMVFVNDGSCDGTGRALRAEKEKDPAVRIISLSRNFGKEAALTAGLDHAEGDVVIPMDVDLQDPPELIGPFIERWRAGADMVYGVRASRASDGSIKRASAGMFYKIFNAMSPIRIPPNAGDYRLLDRRIVEQIRTLKERNRFMKGLMAWPGCRSEAIEFERKPRAAGRTTWNYWKLWNLALDGITSFSTVPLRISLYIGACVSLLSFLYAGFIVIHVFTSGGDVPGYPSLMVAIIFFGGIQLVSIGLVGEYVGRLYHEIKGRPVYIIDAIE